MYREKYLKNKSVKIDTYLLVIFLPFIIKFLKDFFASVAQRAATKTDNNRTPGEGTCFELGMYQYQRASQTISYSTRALPFFNIADNLSLPENTRSCWPVRPIPRRNFLHDAINESNSLNISGQNNQSGSNAAIGVVIPTTPNSSLHQQQNHLNEQLLHHTGSGIAHNVNTHHQTSHNLLQNNILRRTGAGGGSSIGNRSPDFVSSAEATALLSMRVPDGAPQHHLQQQPQTLQLQQSVSGSTGPGIAANNSSSINLNVEERLSQIQDCIRITANLINSIHTDKVRNI